MVVHEKSERYRRVQNDVLEVGSQLYSQTQVSGRQKNALEYDLSNQTTSNQQPTGVVYSTFSNAPQPSQFHHRVLDE